jgi:DNA-binding transcriptional ArsR family regulator
MIPATTRPTGDSLAVLDEAGAAALLGPERRRLVAALRDVPDSASGLAKRLGEKRQRINYHLRALEGAGILEVHEERRRGGFTERVLRVTARRFVIDPAALGDLSADPAEAGDRFSATYLIALAARTIRELAGLRARAAGERKRLATASIDSRVRLARPSDFDAFVRELTHAVGAVVARHQSDAAGAREFRVSTGVYPAPSADPTEQDEEAER